MTINDFKNKSPEEIVKFAEENNNNSFISLDVSTDFSSDKVIAIKDIHVRREHITTAGSKILSSFSSPFDSKVVSLLKENGFHILGTTNMDEFAMGFSNNNSYFGGVPNAKNSEYVAGGSSGGSAYAVASGIVPVATGTDTGGSIRQPAAFNGIYGMKPTYGLISRYGTIAFASSFDTIGVLSSSLLDNAEVLEVLAQNDERDQTNFVPEKYSATSLLNADIKGTKIAYIKEWMDEISKCEVADRINAQIEILEEHGAVVEEISVPTVKYSFELYLILAYSEATANLSRYDGIKYGLNNSTNNFSNYRHNFGNEVRKRLLIGAYMTSSEHSGEHYLQAQKIRTKMKKQFDDVFTKYDLIIGPTTLDIALKDGEGLDSKRGYLYDMFLIPANLTGIPSMSVPMGTGKDNMPLGLQIAADKYNEKKIYQLANFLREKGETNE